LTHPETLVTLLITTEIKKDESIKIENVRRIIDYSGYKEKFECKGTLKH
jgi:poly(ADP-ribose) glycohydrolase